MIHLDFLKAKREQARGLYDQIRSELNTARQTAQQKEAEAINQEGYLRALDELIVEATPAIPLEEALASMGIEQAPDSSPTT